MATLNLNTTTITGTMPAINLPIGNGSDQVAAGDDPRLSGALSSVACIDDLRALPVPVPGCDPLEVATHAYYADAPGGGNFFRWDADSTEKDNGGTVICPDVLPIVHQEQPPGRWLAVNHNTGEANAAQFGANPARTTGSTNRNAIQAAHDSLPVVGGYADTASTPPRRPRTGHLFIPPGTYNLDGNLNFYTGVRVEGGGWRNTTLMLNAGIYTGSSPETYFVNFGHSALTDDNNHFGAELFGLTIHCNFNSHASGVYMVGGQGVRMGECLVTAFGMNGVYFTGAEITTLWVTGNTATGSGLILGGGLNNTIVHSASVEHMNTVRQENDGVVVPYVLIDGAGGVTIEQLTGETGVSTLDGAEIFLKIKDSHSILVRNIVVNKFNNNDALGQQAIIAYITGDSGNVQLDSIATASDPGPNRTSGLLVKDDSLTGAGPRMNYQVDGGVGNTTYKQRGFISALSGQSINVVGWAGVKQPVVTEAFSQIPTAGRFRLRLDYYETEVYLEQSAPFLITMGNLQGAITTALVMLQKDNGGNVITHTQMLAGKGLRVTTMGGLIGDTAVTDPVTGYTGRHVVVDFAWVNSSNIFSMMTVAQLGSQNYNVDNYVWSAVAETETHVLDGSAAGVLRAPGTPPRVVSSECSLLATDSDVEANTGYQAFNIVLHSATGNAGLTRTITNAGSGHNVTVTTPSNTIFADDTYQKVVPPGSSLRLKVNATGTRWLVL